MKRPNRNDFREPMLEGWGRIHWCNYARALDAYASHLETELQKYRISIATSIEQRRAFMKSIKGK